MKKIELNELLKKSVKELELLQEEAQDYDLFLMKVVEYKKLGEELQNGN